jgi:hypothetical protein
LLENFPSELKERPQWCAADLNRVPLNPKTGKAASTNDPSTWGSFDEAVNSGHKFIGYVLAHWDPFFIIDLDRKPNKPITKEQWTQQENILANFNTYAERSLSGLGYHVVGKGKLPNGGIHRGCIEIYSSERFMICTGDVVKKEPVNDCQKLLLSLANYYRDIKPQATELSTVAVNWPDEQIIRMASTAVNSDKFNALYNLTWEEIQERFKIYPSQSEADYALMSMLAYYTPDNEQVRRLFRSSKLGKRPKAVKTNRYLDLSLQRIRAGEPMPVEINLPPIESVALDIIQTSPLGAPQSPPPSPPPPPDNVIPLRPNDFPPGIIGELADYFLATAIKPVPEISLAAAIGLTAGIVGRQWNISGTGLNQYIILVAGTGTGKEGMSRGINNLLHEIRKTVPSIDTFIGPSAFASGQALIRRFEEQKCFVSLLGEFGLTLQQMSNPANTTHHSTLMMRKVMLDLYTKSGWNISLAPSVYSDSTKNTEAIHAPALTLLGETTPEALFNGMDVGHVLEGLIPRFLIIQYEGNRVPTNRNAGCPPTPLLVNKISTIAVTAMAMETNQQHLDVTIDVNAQGILDEFDKYVDNKINSYPQGAPRELWNRAYLKAIKLSGLIAVGCNFNAPIITASIVNWSIQFVTNEITKIVERFEAGNVGSGDPVLHTEVRRLIREYLLYTESKYGVKLTYIKHKIVPYAYLMKRTASLSAFRNDKRGATKSLNSALDDLKQSGEIIELGPKDKVVFGSEQRAFKWIPE